MPVFNSSAVAQAEYDPWKRVLELHFTGSGTPYYYLDVPLEIFEGLCRAPSKGGYFNAHIKDRYETIQAA
jgi:hypothetical protein